NNIYQNIFAANNKNSNWRETIFKIEVFNLIQFEKIVFLDADMIVLNNIDILFTKPHMSAVIAGKSLHKNWVSLNSGLMVIEPNSKDYRGMLDIVENVYNFRNANGLGFGDQDVIKAYYRNWTMLDYLHLDETYVSVNA
ncbi:MAG: hypothetical protein LUH02_04560, partial [Erysipelotrichaceae bacterium]|nr:hypothetical protein [Erysipelotrichaceae bacterium]